MAEANRNRFEQCFFQYRSDRCAPAKLAQAYQVLAPNRTHQPRQLKDESDESDRRHLCAGLQRPAKGTGDDCQPKGGVTGLCAGPSVHRPAGVAV